MTDKFVGRFAQTAAYDNGKLVGIEWGDVYVQSFASPEQIKHVQDFYLKKHANPEIIDVIPVMEFRGYKKHGDKNDGIIIYPQGGSHD